ncbi:hypothetical protein GIB67_030910 [Kingdonia uniflora]|uniref:Uncharacterized protein n=1 Tax=Kingdonia uniflora TaxID=39325 RepID=A0A7J7L3D6_9MAGN|nr:hypothetical protein GIB67_030910 [Kingdonia uniflora]
MHHHLHDGRFSTVDGFINVNDSTVKMIKYVANESSVGLYFVQQHTHNALPNLLHLKEKIVDASAHTLTDTQGSDDDITMLKSIKQYALSVVHHMIQDINNSLNIMSASHPQTRLIHSRNSGLQRNKSSVIVEETTSGFVSTVFRSAKQKAVNIKWPQFDGNQSFHRKGEQVQFPNLLLSEVAPTSVSALQGIEAEELPLSSHILDEQLNEAVIEAHQVMTYHHYQKIMKSSKLVEKPNFKNGWKNVTSQAS